MPSRAVKPRREETLLSGWESMPERAPSSVAAEEPTFVRVLAMIGLFLVVLGGLALLLPRWTNFRPVVGPGLGILCLSVGVFLLLVHAFADHDWSFRRLYSFLGLFGILLALILRVMPGEIGAAFIPVGLPLLALSLVLLIATARQETEAGWRAVLMNVLALVGAALTVVPLIVALFASTGVVNNWLPGEGGLLLLLGLGYVGAYIALQPLVSERGYYAGLALGAAGLVAMLGGLARSFVPESTFLVPSGLILLGVGLLYLAIAAGTCLDWPVVVLARRELASYFYSPIAYLVLAGIIVVGWLTFQDFLTIILFFSERGGLTEPIVKHYFVELIPVYVQMFVVPILTMRLLAEEKRTGTFEVLLTAPVNESTVVLGKFLAAWAFYLLLWLPWWLYLVALRYYGGESFDYRPLLSFSLALLAVSAGFIAMGLFFSSLTRNQIIAAVLTFVGMTAHLVFYLTKVKGNMVPGTGPYEVLTYISFIDLWWDTLHGQFAPRYLLFHVSLTVLFLYGTTKVLDARKWQ